MNYKLSYNIIKFTDIKKMDRKPNESNEPITKLYGLKVLEDNPNIAKLRRPFEFDFPVNETTPSQHPVNETTPSQQIIDFINNTLKITTTEGDPVIATMENTRAISKELPKKGLPFHIDDCQLVKKSTLLLEPDPTEFTLIKAPKVGKSRKHIYLFRNATNSPTGNPARITVLFYSSTWGKDFTGGELVLADGTIIKPEKGHGYIIDSREAHMVNPVKSGIRNVTLVKIY